MPLLQLLVVADRERPRTDERHLAEEDVHDLRHLVEREPAQEAAQGRHARVVLDLEQRPRCFVCRLERGLARGRVRVHRAELQHPELLLTETDALVAVEDGPARGELDRGRDREPERQAHHDPEARDDDVEPALQRPLPPGERRWPQLEQRRSLAGDVFGALHEEIEILLGAADSLLVPTGPATP